MGSSRFKKVRYREIINLDATIIKFIYPRLKKYKKDYIDKYSPEEKETVKYILQEMRKYLKDKPNNSVGAMHRLAEIFPSLWI